MEDAGGDGRPQCFVALKRAGDWLRHMALHCARDGVLSRRPLPPAETTFQWWLSEANTFELNDLTKAPVWQIGNLSGVRGPVYGISLRQKGPSGGGSSSRRE